VKTVETGSRVARVYNFAVAQNANYFVGEDGVLVHNSKNRCNYSGYSDFLGWSDDEVNQAVKDKTNPKTGEPLSKEELEKLKTDQKQRGDRNKQKRGKKKGKK